MSHPKGRQASPGASVRDQLGLGVNIELRLLIALSALGMICFGLSYGVLAIAWPSMSESFGVAVTSLGVVVAVTTTTFAISTFMSGWFLRKTSLGVFLTFGAMVMGSSYLAYVVVPDWWMLLLVAGGAGVGLGLIDTGLNVFAAVNLNARLTNWIHSFFGLGNLAGSSIMTGLLVIGAGWQWGYVAVGGTVAVLAIGFGLTRTRWHSGLDRSVKATGGARMTDTLRVPAAWLGIAAFGLYSALEVAAGVWTFTLLTEGRGLSVAAAGGWATAYFSGMFAGRVALGTFAGAVSLPRLLRFSGALSLLGAIAFWQAPTDEIAFVGLVLLGVGFGPIFPTLISATPSYVGDEHTSNAIGFQLAAGALGGGLLPLGVGAIAAATSLEAVAVSLVLGSALLLVVLWMFAAGRPAPTRAPAPFPGE